MPAKSQYELDREANIAKNRALFEDLGLKQTLESLGTSSAKPTNSAAKPVAAKRTKRERAEDSFAPRRVSRRLQKKQGEDIEETEEERKLRKEQDAIEEEARKEADEKARLAKRPRHDALNFSTLAEANSPEDLSSLSTTMKNVLQLSRRAADSEAYVFKEDAEKQEKREVQAIREKVQNLKVVSRAKVVQDRIYCAAYHPELTKDLLFFGDKAGMLGIWDARAPQDEMEVDGDISPDAPENREGGKYWRLQVHWPATSKSSISCVKVDPIDSHNVYTSAYDCSVRSLSFVSGVSNELYSNDQKILLTSFDLPPSGQEMWISDTTGGVTHLDLRETKSKARRYGLSDNKIGTVSVNPTRSHFLVTASNSRVVKIWDSRKLNGMPISLLDNAAQGEASDTATSRTSVVDFDYDVVNQYNETTKGKGTMRAEFPHGKSASSAYWDPRGRQIVSTSYDDRIRLWDISSPTFKTDGKFPNLKPFSQLRHNCQTGRWLTILRAQWSTNPEEFPYFSVGNMDHSLDLYSCKGELITQLTDRTLISAVQAVTCTHPSLVERAASGNASGRVNLWAPVALKDE